ncbi:hypothetical protein U1Q18_020164 [Sarracenia purpurea var. burkii]
MELLFSTRQRARPEVIGGDRRKTEVDKPPELQATRSEERRSAEYSALFSCGEFGIQEKKIVQGGCVLDENVHYCMKEVSEFDNVLKLFEAIRLALKVFVIDL